ncbi:MAG: hypothetical protein PHV43_00875 [Candidatus Colwellbacteria bacterium]|nr:hypothetical protein [Candidatus Colwellbacteria bacterium]
MKELFWTKHARDKMRYYRLPESRVRRVIKSHERIEEGVAENTIALMQRTGSGKNEHEIWVMVADKGKQRRVVSAWRYPGKTEPGVSLPDEILREFRAAALD